MFMCAPIFELYFRLAHFFVIFFCKKLNFHATWQLEELHSWQRRISQKNLSRKVTKTNLVFKAPPQRAG